ncbi:MAG: hypothetical protein O2787_05140 [Cyanobacteria bacterium]|nr:hypothetical protein [Cyanobacteriota bacterium]
MRLDQINSSLVIKAARRILLQSIELSNASHEPSGVVLNSKQILQGRIVFDQPVLLPDEQFVPINLIRGRLARSGTTRLRLPRKPSPAPFA